MKTIVTNFLFSLLCLQCLGRQPGRHRQPHRAGHGPGQEPPDVRGARGGGGPQGEDRAAGGAHGKDTDREPDPKGTRAQRGKG